MDKAINQFIDCVSEELGVDIRNPRRLREIVEGRQLAMYFIRCYLPFITLKQIGNYFTGKDHATVLHSYHNIQTLLETDDTVRRKYARIKVYADRFLHLNNEDERIKTEVSVLLHENAINWSNLGTRSARDMGSEREVMHRWGQIKQRIRELSPATYSQIVAD